MDAVLYLSRLLRQHHAFGQQQRNDSVRVQLRRLGTFAQSGKPDRICPKNEPELLLNRGYTGHKHLPAFGLVNMISLVVIIFIFYKLNEAVSKARNLQLYPLDNTLWRG
jgi:hypothetical protein